MVKETKCALAVFVKAPRVGEVKTRLVPPLTDVEASGLYEAFLKDIAERLKSLPHDIDIHIFYTPDDNAAIAELSAIFKGYQTFIPQIGLTLGDRLTAAFEHLFNDGYAKIAIIGSDSPDLPVEYIEEAFFRLTSTSAEIVLGPAKDGGYYLVAMGKRHYSIFEGINWSTSSVLSETIERAKADGLEVTLLREWYDVDTSEDLKSLIDVNDARHSTSFISTSFIRGSAIDGKL